MKKILLSSALSLLLYSAINAQTLVTNQIVTKGIRYQKYTMTGPNQEIHVLQVDLLDPTVKLQSVKSSGVLGGTKLTVKQLAASKDANAQYHNVVGGVNGDFFSLTTANPVNVMVPDGQVLVSKFLPVAKSIFGISDGNDPFIALPSEQYQVIKAGVSRTIDSVNRARGTNNLILYNQYKGTTTGTNTFGTELRIGLASGQKWQVNGQVQCVVLEKKVLQAGMAIPAGQAVLSGNGSSKTYLDGFNVGDALTLDLRVATGVSNTIQVMGGYPRILTNGVNSASVNVISEGGSSSDDTTPDNPHTGIGISQDESTLYMVVVDGRAPGLRNGMTLTQFSSFMSSIGAYNAVNLDGGGSSTLVSNNVVKNVPSDGSERIVSSALLVWSTALLMDDFEVDEGRYYRGPNYDGVYTVGISTSTLDRVTSTSYSGIGSERAVLNDNTSSSSAWTVRLLSGSGLPAENYSIASTGTIGIWLKTNTAQAGAKIHLWFDDTDGAEQTPGINIINDNQWHHYNFDLNYTSGGTAITGNGLLTGANVSLDAIVLKQPNPPAGALPWTIYFDEVTHNRDGSGTGASLIAQQPLQENVVKIAELDLEPVLYSNPNDGNFTIDFKQQDVEGFKLEVVSFELGRIVHQTILKENNQLINAGKLPEGLYSVNVTGIGYSKRLRMIVKN